MQKKDNQIKELQESKQKNNAYLEGRIKQLETDRDILKERVYHLEQELCLAKERLMRLEPAEVTEAYLNLGALCDRVQSMMYRQVFPEKFCPETAVFKVKDIEKELSKGGTEANGRWNALQKELKWDPERHLEAIKICKKTRTKRAHPDTQLTEESLTKSIAVLKNKGHIREDWLSLQVLQELLNMWKMLKK